MKLLITGGAGFIGSNFIKYMLEKHDNDLEIFNLDKLTYAGNLENLSDVENKDNYHFIKGDICDSDVVENVIKRGIEVVINFAAESHVDKSIKEPGLFLKTNVLGTQVLLNNSLKYSINKFIQISTDEVYGPGKKHKSYIEEERLSPTNPYSASKASADFLVNSYYNTYGLPVNIIRSTNNYGCYQYPEKIIPLFVTNALEDKKLPLYGDGENIRDWIHVKDHCKAIKLLIEKGQNGEIYNVSSDNKIKNIELTKIMLNYLNKPESLIKYVKDRQGHDIGYYISAEKIKNKLNWKSDYDFEKGLKDTIDWYKDNYAWWKRLK